MLGSSRIFGGVVTSSEPSDGSNSGSSSLMAPMYRGMDKRLGIVPTNRSITGGATYKPFQRTSPSFGDAPYTPFHRNGPSLGDIPHTPFNRSGPVFGDAGHKPFNRNGPVFGDAEYKPFNRSGPVFGDAGYKPFNRSGPVFGDAEYKPFNRSGPVFGDAEYKPFNRSGPVFGDAEYKPFCEEGPPLPDADYKPFPGGAAPGGDASCIPFHKKVIATPYTLTPMQPQSGQPSPPVPTPVSPPVSVGQPPLPMPIGSNKPSHNYFEDFESYGESHPNHGDKYRAGDWIAGPGNEIEILDENTYLKNGSTNRVLETEAPDGGNSVYRDFITGQGERFVLSLDYSPRDGHERDSAIEVYWEGKKIGTLSAADDGMQKFTFNVIAEAISGTSRLEFRSIDSDGTGGIVDNISLQSMGY